MVSVPRSTRRTETTTVLPLTGRLRNYPWGSPNAIYDLLGVPPTGEPGAELWLGTHPADPSDVETATGPVPATEVLGELPFLLKVLAAQTPLSLQVHPTLEQARLGFAADERAGILLDASARRYRDRNHKPELLVALTPFRALAGIRDPAITLPVVDALGGEGGQGDALRAAFAPLAGPPGGAGQVLRGLLTTPREWGATLVDRLAAGAARVRGRGHADPAVTRAADLVGTLVPIYPGDVGVAAALLLNDVTIAPGDALFQPARMLHSYVRGVGIEIMAASDNVLRGGLTPKHVDVDELLTILDPAVTDPPIVHPRTVLHGPGGRLRVWDVPVRDFTLAEAECDGELTVPAATIILVVEGAVDVTTPGARALTLRRGQAGAFAGAGELTLRGRGRVFLAGG